MNLVRLYVTHVFSRKSKIRLLDPLQVNATGERKVLFKETPHDFAITTTQEVKEPQEADFLIVPQSIRKITPDIKVYLDEVGSHAESLNKQVIVFLTGDLCHRVHIQHPAYIVFKPSEYRSARRSNEILFASFTEDLGERVKSSLRVKGSRKPIVGFCGYAGFPNLRARIKYYFENFFLDLSSRTQYKRGIYFRRKAIQLLERDTRIEKLFVIRSSFSGNTATIKEDPQSLRSEFIENILESDFILCPKGDGNFSARFYETLSLGRIPVLIDTDMILPFEQYLDYSTFTIRVPYHKIGCIGNYIMDIWNKLSDEEYAEMQKRAREVYRNYLRFDAYFNKALPLLKQGGVQAVL
ncbi:MAG TPA: exostosin family protein [Candidatus Paceibacterota bacterium]|nr:exostosin family protein [Candidatus Paceibacterota bacterium]